MLWISVFIVFIVIILGWFGIVFYQRRVSLRIDSLDQEKKKLLDPSIDEEFVKLKQSSPSGESLVDLNHWQQVYERVKNRQLVDLETFFFKAEDANNKFQFVQGRQRVAELEKKLKDSKKDIAEIKQALFKIQDVQDLDKKLIDGINNELTDVKRSILSKGYAYGPAQDILENRLSKIDEAYDSAQQVYLGGDYSKAKALFETITHELADLKNDMKEISILFEQVNKTFPGQLKEIRATYEKMKASGYKFIDDDFDNKILTLQNLVDQTKELLTQAAIDDIRANCEHISKEIDKLYTILEREYKSHRKVKNTKDDLYQFIIHAGRQNRTLSENIYQASNTFVLKNNEEKQAADFELQIENIRLDYNRDMQKVTDKEAVLSVINRDFELWRKQLTEIEQRQIEIVDEVSKKYDKLEEFKKDLLDYDSAFKVIARYVEKENLPGVLEDYREFYLVVSKELKKMKSLITSSKIDIDEIENVSSLLKEDLITLSDQTNEMVKNSRLTEILIQNAIQYQETNPSVTQSINKAKEIYANQFDYGQAVNVLAKELELIKPGSFQEIAANYNESDEIKIQL
ncbi:septation ring formation regulator EzrA [Xylocopilactobacillus apis]|uniref:Septation ring formation regulator EzrA n=1 Tax=Xylocopilactobacillus apis TaxID=2932183 RepID=A0AAU9D455_9LACO|nr:septation ring formation regulator EzrA [Xylocopilactobacillus apis]BDR56200.1 hypothetical protein KIMC2_07620 [Xylocopilactobacillus apis]